MDNKYVRNATYHVKLVMGSNKASASLAHSLTYYLMADV